MISGSIIIAIGAQNAFVLKQGLLKQNVGIVVFLCWFCDCILMSFGVLGVGALIAESHIATMILALTGGLFLLGYGVNSAKRAWRGGGHISVNASNTNQPASALKAATTTLMLTLLNPHVYVDTLMLIGGSAVTLSTSDKLLFLIGALLASAIWFIGIGYGARFLLPLFRRERVWQWLDGFIAMMMLYLAYGLFKQIFPLLT